MCVCFLLHYVVECAAAIATPRHSSIAPSFVFVVVVQPISNKNKNKFYILKTEPRFEKRNLVVNFRSNLRRALFHRGRRSIRRRARVDLLALITIVVIIIIIVIIGGVVVVDVDFADAVVRDVVLLLFFPMPIAIRLLCCFQTIDVGVRQRAHIGERQMRRKRRNDQPIGTNRRESAKNNNNNNNTRSK